MAICKNPRKIYRQLWTAMSASLSFMLIGMARGYSSPAIPSMNSTGGHQLDLDDVSLVASLPAAGALISALFSGPCLNIFGRRKTLLLTALPWSASFLLVGFSAHNKWVLFAGRVLMGMMIGLSAPSAQIYIAECSSPRVRGTLGSLTALFLAAGILLTYILGSLVEWNTLAWILSSSPLVLLVAMSLAPESPSWLLSKQRDQEASDALQLLRGAHTDISSELDRIRINSSSIQRSSSQVVPRWSDLLEPAVTKPLSIVMGLMVFQQLSGINVVIFFTVSIFKAAGSTINDYVATIIIGAVQLVCTFPTMFLVDRFGRRILLIFSGLFMSLSSMSMATYFYFSQPTVTTDDDDQDPSERPFVHGLGWLPLASLVSFVIAYSSGYSNVPFLIMSEVFPVKYRGLFGSLAAWCNQLCIFGMLFTFPRFSQLLGNYGVFSFYALCSLLGVVFVHFVVPETKGKTLEDIEQLFSGKGPQQFKYSPAKMTEFERETCESDSHVNVVV